MASARIFFGDTKGLRGAVVAEVRGHGRQAELKRIRGDKKEDGSLFERL